MDGAGRCWMVLDGANEKGDLGKSAGTFTWHPGAFEFL